FGKSAAHGAGDQIQLLRIPRSAERVRHDPAVHLAAALLLAAFLDYHFDTDIRLARLPWGDSGCPRIRTPESGELGSRNHAGGSHLWADALVAGVCPPHDPLHHAGERVFKPAFVLWLGTVSAILAQWVFREPIPRSLAGPGLASGCSVLFRSAPAELVSDVGNACRGLSLRQGLPEISQ